MKVKFIELLSILHKIMLRKQTVVMKEVSVATLFFLGKIKSKLCLRAKFLQFSYLITSLVIIRASFSFFSFHDKQLLHYLQQYFACFIGIERTLRHFENFIQTQISHSGHVLLVVVCNLHIQITNSMYHIQV